MLELVYDILHIGAVADGTVSSDFREGILPWRKEVRAYGFRKSDSGVELRLDLLYRRHTCRKKHE